MGTVEFTKNEILISSHIVTYGNGATPGVTSLIRNEIETMWNEPVVFLEINESRRVRFQITAEYLPNISPVEICSNTDARINYFRIEDYAMGNISFVDGVGCNTGYFKSENLYAGSTTAAHEYGHTIGLEHPKNIDLRGQGVPGIMYPRGTLVDPEFQYNPSARPGDNTDGGTMHPKFRKVSVQDILLLNLHKIEVENGKGIIGAFSSVWHQDHSDMGIQPDIRH
jgi:hypothetical protein